VWPTGAGLVYTGPMADILQRFWPVFLAAVAVVLVLGLINMMRGGPATRSQMLMRWRVILQFIAIGVVMLTLYLAQMKNG
jgi:hypothetical protein